MANEQNPQNQAPEQTEQANEAPTPKYLTSEELNGAMTARERRFEQRLMKMFDERFAASAKPAAAAEDAGETEAAAPKGMSEDAIAVKRATAQLAAMQKQMQAKEEAAAKEKAELLRRQERSDALSLLTEAGCSNAKGAYAMLKDEGRILRNADGELVMKVMKEYGEDEVPIAEGIKHWLSTDDGKHYLPPRGGGNGSGTVVRGGATRGGAPVSKEEARRDAQNVLSKFILG